MKFYLIGKSGEAQEEQRLFFETEKQLKQIGHDVYNVMDNHSARQLSSLQTQIHQRITSMFRCDAVFLLPGFTDDQIATIELILAMQTGMRIFRTSQTIIPRQLIHFLPNEIFKFLNHPNDVQ